MSLRVKVDECIPLTGPCINLLDTKVGCHAGIRIGTKDSGVSFKFGNGDATLICPPALQTKKP
jgi:hypothetical protein